MNYYVLFCQTLKTEKVCQILNRKKDVHAFIPRMETYIHSKDEIILKVMFPGYLFIETNMNQKEFDILLNLLNEEKDGIIKELKKDDVSALTDDEIQLMYQLLNKNGILKMSEGYKVNGKTIITKGPLLHFQDEIIDTNKRDMFAILDIKFFNRNIKAGLMFKQNN
ncbi:MAG: transcription termination/antitermination NusG family protein [Massilimicrobiota sp.]|nr:transcription termination/antitermination NusG family protein [Massilimicrobiota sp.]